MFYAQLSVTTKYKVCAEQYYDDDQKKYDCLAVNADRACLIWLIIETVAYYSYLAGSMAYIVYNQCLKVAGYQDASEKSDFNKVVTDFIKYANINITYFAFNMVLVILPLACIFFIQPVFTYTIPGNEKSYAWIVYLLAVA